MTIEMIPSFNRQQQFNMNVDNSFHQATMAAAAGSAAAAHASSHHLNYSTTATPNHLNGYFTHPYYQQHQQQPSYHPLMDPYHSDFRPTFYNPFEIKHRRRTSRAQLKVLEKSFLDNAKPNASVRRYLAQELEMTPRGVQIWFQNRRAKAKLQKRKSQQQLSPVPNAIDTASTTSSNNNPSNACFMSSVPNSTISTHSSTSFSPSAVTPSSTDVLFYPLDDIPSTQSPAFMPDQSWLAMPMHPLSSPSSCDGNNSSTPHQEPRRQSCPLLSNTSSLYERSDIQNRRVSDQFFSPATPNTVANGPGSSNSNGLNWMVDSTDTVSCCSSTNGSGSSHCGTPGWSLDTFATVNQHSPLTDPSLFDIYQQPQQQQQICMKPEDVNTVPNNTTTNNAMDLYTTPVSSSSHLNQSNYQTSSPSLMSSLM